MSLSTSSSINAKKVFKEKGTCSRTFAFLLNKEFQNEQENYEKALDPLAGGVMRKGHQCGMLWGAVLAIGAESYKKTKEINKAAALALIATKEIMASFEDKTGTVSCREITGCNMDSFFGLTKYMLKVTIQGMDNSRCFNLAEEWAPNAINVAKKSLEKHPENHQTSINCASVVVEKLGGTNEEIAMVAGFAGGMGLSGDGCGALAAAIWMNSLTWLKDNPGKSAYSNSNAKTTLKRFTKKTDSELKCRKICGEKFNSIQEHTAFVNQGGCKEIVEILSQ